MIIVNIIIIIRSVLFLLHIIITNRTLGTTKGRRLIGFERYEETTGSVTNISQSSRSHETKNQIMKVWIQQERTLIRMMELRWAVVAGA